jgi:hypothetical protein
MPWLVTRLRTTVAPGATSLLDGAADGKGTPLGQFSILRPARARLPPSLAQGISSRLISRGNGSVTSKLDRQVS